MSAGNVQKKKKDNSPYVHQSRKRSTELTISEAIPWNAKQRDLISKIKDKNTKIIFVRGPAGTSKTICAVYAGLHLLREKRVSDILYIRSVVESASNKLGFLPGELADKFSPYIQPLLEKLDELLPRDQADRLQAENFVAAVPVNYLRGCHFAGKFIFIDEAQNFTKEEMTTLLTRIGEFCKVIICGDPMQSDLHNGQKLTFNKFFDAFSDSADAGILTFEFGKEDIVRSEVVRYIVDIIEKIP